MDDVQRFLSPDERRAFDDLADRFEQTLPSVPPVPRRLPPVRREHALRWASLIAIGVVIGSIGLFADLVVIAFVGFVAVLTGLDRLMPAPSTNRSTTGWSARRHSTDDDPE